MPCAKGWPAWMMFEGSFRGSFASLFDRSSVWRPTTFVVGRTLYIPLFVSLQSPCGLMRGGPRPYIMMVVVMKDYTLMSQEDYACQ